MNTSSPSIGGLSPSASPGARSYAEIDREFQNLLEMGATESRTHIEQMSLNMARLLAHSFPSLAAHADRLNQPRFLDRMRSGAMILQESFGENAADVAAKSASDTVRGWGAFSIGLRPGLSIHQQLDLIRPFACDPHFAVREWAWLAVRPAVRSQTHDALSHLLPWATDASISIRRFATEVTRPRGVWSAHLQVLKSQPWIARDLLDAVCSDEARYVQNSLGNWLNDSSKDQPAWVRLVCAEWESRNPEATAYVRRRALRTIQGSMVLRGRVSC
jgi:3-methyladenine DNA glycosylase AlkC